MKDFKKIVLEYIELVWNGNDIEALKKMTSSDFKYFLGDQLSFDLNGFQKFLASTHESFPDWKVNPINILEDKKMVAVQWKGEVTHNGIFHGIKPSGKQIKVSGINLYKFENEKIISEWEQTDTISILRQLGALPS
jgi:steroid delta-isomerase-like uncharacterized protein